MYASYQLTRRLWLWRWDADFRGQTSAYGTSLSKSGARRKARLWIRNRQAAAAAEPAVAVDEPIRLAA